MPVPEIKWPKHSICNLKRSHLEGFTFIPAYQTSQKPFSNVLNVHIPFCFTYDVVYIENKKIIKIFKE